MRLNSWLLIVQHLSHGLCIDTRRLVETKGWQVSVWWWPDPQSDGQGLLTAGISIGQSFIQFPHRLSMLSQLSVPSSRIILIQSFTAILMLFFYYIWHQEVSGSPSGPLYLNPLYCLIISGIPWTLLGFYPGIKAQVPSDGRSHNLHKDISLVSPQPEAWSTEQGTKLSFSGTHLHLLLASSTSVPPNSGKCHSFLSCCALNV